MKKDLYHKIGLRLVSPPSTQLELFPLSSFYSSCCMTTKVCYKKSCVSCRYVSSIRKDYDYFLNNDDSLL